MLCHIYHIFAQLVFRLVDSRSIQENDLASFICIHRLDPVSGGLGLIRGNGDLLADQMIHQRGFSYVGTADQCDKA